MQFGQQMFSLTVIRQRYRIRTVRVWKLLPMHGPTHMEMIHTIQMT